MSAPVQALIDRTLSDRVKDRARQIGFDLVGIAPASPSQWQGYFRQWLDRGHAGEMTYLASRFNERTDAGHYFPGAQSAICVAINYYVPLEALPADRGGEHGRIARYALGDDYHELMKTRLHALADWLREELPGSRTRACVDTAPVMEKELAARAGIGWLGKNTCLIHPRAGSWLLLGEILTDAVLTPDEPKTDHCGACTRCIDACPTGAITAPYQLDAQRCISYLTIEHRGEISGELQEKIGSWLYGCDVCQDVCPYNRNPPHARDSALRPRFATGSLDVSEVMNWSEEDYRRNLRGSAMKRVKLPVLRRNAQIVADNARRNEPSSPGALALKNEGHT